MRRALHLFLLLALCLLTPVAHAQKAPLLPLDNTHHDSPPLSALYARHAVSQMQLDKNGIPTFLEGELTPAQHAATPVEMAYSFFHEQQALYRMADPRAELRLSKSSIDESGTTHLTLAQYSGDVPVFQSQIKVHVSADRRLTAVNGRYYPGIHERAHPTVAASAAEDQTLRELNVPRSEAAFGATQLVFYPLDDRRTLAWWVDVTTTTGEAWWYLVDAHKGAVLHRYTRVFDAAAGSLAPAELRARESTPLESADEERCLVGTEVWVRHRGETRFQRAEAACELPDVPASHGGSGSLDDVMWAQGFEGTFPTLGWVVGDSSSLNGQDYWDEASCRAHSGTFSAWCAKAGSTNSCARYDNSMRAYMRTPSVNLTGRTNCLLSYWWWNNSEPVHDFFQEYYSTDGVRWYPGARRSGNDTSWHNATVNLNGFGLYYELFLFSSNLSVNNYEGAYIDDLTITADWAPCGEIGAGPGVLGATRTHLDADYAAGLFRLNDLTRRSDTLCWHNHAGQMAAGAAIATHNFNGSWPAHVGTLLTDADNVWTTNPAAVDAHFFAARYYDFLLAQFGRNGPTGTGASMESTVNVSTLFNRAAYSQGRVGYGIVGSGHRSMAGAPDLVGHEWSHGIVESESGLLAEKESGALAESFADVIGIAFSFLTSADPDWQMGENWNVGGLADRDLSNPPSRNQPDFYGGAYWVPQASCTPTSVNDYCGIHVNSGVGNKFFYLLAQGGVVHGVTVTGIGIANAATVLYRANRDYWTPTTDYAAARAGCIAAAGELNAAWVVPVTDAWAAVGVGDPSEHPLACSSPVALTSGVAFGGTTVGAPRNVLDYATCPWRESGPERVHRLTLTRAATLNIALSHTTANLDVFLLNTCGDEACIAYGDSVIRYTAAPGTYFIVVDGFQGAESAYRLTATAVGTILLTAPNGGEVWYTGENRVITWSSSLTENLRLEIDRNYPSAWSPLALNVSNSGVYTWLVTGPVSDNVRVRITGAQHPAVGDTSNASLAIATRGVHLTSPNGGEVWTIGDTQNVTWTSFGMEAESLRIEIKRSYPLGVWEPLALRAPNTGSFSWSIAGTASNTARIRILGSQHTAVMDTSDAGFVLTAGGVNPTLTLVAPDGGENWAVSSVREIRWISSGMAENVQIELNRNYPSGLWERLVTSTLNDGVHPWTVTGPTTSAARVRISGTVSLAIVDTSQTNFTISSSGGSGTLTVLEPNGGESWTVGTGRTIRWTTSGFSEYVKIQLNRTYPAGYWITLISSTPNDGAHNWMVTPSATTRARIRITGATSTAIGDTSDADFTVAASSLLMSGPGQISGLADLATPIPTEARLAQNYPNPFNPVTTFEFGVPEAMAVKLYVYDITGREVAALLDGEVSAGWHRLSWNCAACPAGVYLIVLQGDNFHLVQKATFLK